MIAAGLSETSPLARSAERKALRVKRARIVNEIANVSLPGKNGAQGRIRTTDTRIFSPLLYQLSYLGFLGYLGEAAASCQSGRRSLNGKALGL